MNNKKSLREQKAEKINGHANICLGAGIISLVATLGLVNPVIAVFDIVPLANIIFAIYILVSIRNIANKDKTAVAKGKAIIGLVLSAIPLAFLAYILWAMQYL